MDTDIEPMLGDGEFPVRYLRSRDAQDAWIAEHNPHLGDTPEWYGWNADFYHDQAAAVLDPKRDTWARAMRIMIVIQIVCAGLAALVIATEIVIHANG